MAPQFVTFVVVTSWLRNRAPTIGVKNIVDVDHFQQINYFVHPEIHQKSQQQKCSPSEKKHSRSRGVAKISVGTPMLHGSSFFLCFPCSMGVRTLTFATPLGREHDFFHFFNTSPVRSFKMMKMWFWNHCLGVTFSRIPYFANEF